jgi:isopentenyl diphosphate isomerase/L-lactate dehydrogenase-like FMN-dependent dehydrogenase
MAVADLAGEMADVLRTAMFCLGIPSIQTLKSTPALQLDTARCT